MSTLLSTVTIGRLGALFDTYSAEESLAGELQLTAQASPETLTAAQVEATYDDLLGLDGALVPVTFADKAFLSGYYTVSGVDLSHWSYPGLVGLRRVVLTAKLTLRRVGYAGTVDLESRLSGAQTRVNAHSLTGERWHAAPAGHTAYFTSTGTPSTLSVTGAEGALTIYRALTVGQHPRWACPLASYGAYRVRLLDATGRERTGVTLALPTTGWEVHNSLVRLRVDSGGLKIASHDGTQWEEKTYTVTVGSVLGTPTAVSVVRNEYHAVTVRCLWSSSPGRTAIDLTIRRGSRLVEGYVNTQPSASIVITQAAAEATSAPGSAGYIVATANDAAGNTYMIGSAGAFTANTGNRTITKTSATSMDFVAGQVVGGTAAPSGDQATNLMARYLGVTAEKVRGVRR